MNENAFEAAADNEKAFRQELRAIETDAENESGLSPLPRGFWREVALHMEDREEGMARNGEIQYDDYAANKDTLRVYRTYVDSHIETAKFAVQTFGRATGDDTKSKPTKIYRKTFERRFHLLAFVLDRKGFEHRARKGFWKEMTAEWNREHPYDQRTPEDLRARYADYIKDDSLWNAYVATRITPAFDRGIKSAMEALKATSTNALMQPILEFWKQHPEAKTLNDLIRIEEAQNDRKHNEKR